MRLKELCIKVYIYFFLEVDREGGDSFSYSIPRFSPFYSFCRIQKELNSYKICIYRMYILVRQLTMFMLNTVLKSADVSHLIFELVSQSKTHGFSIRIGVYSQ